MHPAAMWWWKQARRAARDSGCEAHAGCGPAPGPGRHGEGRGRDAAESSTGGWFSHPFDPGGGPFGVRRPLRFLAHKLDLDDKQVAEIAKVLDDLKTERAQAAVDDRRAAAAFAEALESDPFDDAGVTRAGEQRLASAERLRDAVAKALQRIHALLRPEQRADLATLIRTGVVTI